MKSFKEYIRNLKKRKKKQKLPGALTSVHRDTSNMPPTATLPAGSGTQPSL